ncbi:MAG: molecular chaperone DnaK [Bacteroidetes bacterium GWE2_39_28]|nr:MAG: molecular chaperone DnaK [Bacteroidetes bacterium GWE2_39_28]OFZ06720.1 MAG: molecular chaperone DnaK [Bacteroidetes bacterium RIFOXYB2_FULL_39_7]OFZ10120.1 MAG: molecular chaperone DnaK [Bacteroidetes bacterium RIFOXYC2_FULL_39_11]HCT94623.1 molecular chaperone DnaK [Rikenellaceae bacterium]HCV15446.1 molecular chaperone DnaK [Rikenellaceae bacterium]
MTKKGKTTDEGLEKVRYSDEELQMFKDLILQKLEIAKIEYQQLKAAVTHSSSNDTEDTSPTFKVLEEGASALSKEEAGQLAQRQYKFIQSLEAALIRIENKSYGICRETGKLIQKERLLIVPHATLSVEAKNKRD